LARADAGGALAVRHGAVHYRSPGAGYRNRAFVPESARTGAGRERISRHWRTRLCAQRHAGRGAVAARQGRFGPSRRTYRALEGSVRRRKTHMKSLRIFALLTASLVAAGVIAQDHTHHHDSAAAGQPAGTGSEMEASTPQMSTRDLSDSAHMQMTTITP